MLCSAWQFYPACSIWVLAMALALPAGTCVRGINEAALELANSCTRPSPEIMTTPWYYSTERVSRCSWQCPFRSVSSKSNLRLVSARKSSTAFRCFLEFEPAFGLKQIISLSLSQEVSCFRPVIPFSSAIFRVYISQTLLAKMQNEVFQRYLPVDLMNFFRFGKLLRVILTRGSLMTSSWKPMRSLKGNSTRRVVQFLMTTELKVRLRVLFEEELIPKATFHSETGAKGIFSEDWSACSIRGYYISQGQIKQILLQSNHTILKQSAKNRSKRSVLSERME